MVYLSEIASEEDLEQLSAKQMKDLLAMNRVAFRGVVEKEELAKIIRRLWNQERRAKEGERENVTLLCETDTFTLCFFFLHIDKDRLEDSDLCKVCMDNPVDCVMLECGHMATCTDCGKQMNECPICRQYVVRVVKTFKS